MIDGLTARSFIELGHQQPVSFIEFEGPFCVDIEEVNTFQGTDPQVPVLIVQNVRDAGVRKTAAHGIVLECIFFVVALVSNQVDPFAEATKIILPFFIFKNTSDLFIDFAFGITHFVLIVYTFVGISGIFKIDDIHAVSANP